MELVNRTLGKMVLRDKGAEQSWKILKDAFKPRIFWHFLPLPAPAKWSFLPHSGSRAVKFLCLEIYNYNYLHTGESLDGNYFTQEWYPISELDFFTIKEKHKLPGCNYSKFILYVLQQNETVSLPSLQSRSTKTRYLHGMWIPSGWLHYSCSTTHKDQTLNLRSQTATHLALLTSFSELSRDVNRSIRNFQHVSLRNTEVLFSRSGEVIYSSSALKEGSPVYFFLLFFSCFCLSHHSPLLLRFWFDWMICVQM